MKLIVTEFRNGLIEIEKKVTTLHVAPFDTAVGSINLGLVTAKGQLLVGTGNAAVSALNLGNDGEVLMVDSTRTEGVKWASAGGGASSVMTNRSGSTVVAGDVIVNDSAYDRSFKTTTVASDLRVIGVAGENISALSEGKVLTFWGTIATVNCDTGAVARGDLLVTSTTAKRARSIGAVRSANKGVFAMALTYKLSGYVGPVQALLMPTLYYGQIGSASFILGGTDGTIRATAEKFVFASGLATAISSADLPQPVSTASASTYGTVAGFTYSGNLTSGTTTNTHRMPYATEITAVDTSAAVPAVSYRAAGSIGRDGLSAVFQRAYSGSAYTTTIYKHTFSSDLVSTVAATLGTARGYTAMTSDGSIYGGLHGGTTGSDAIVADKYALATDTSASDTPSRPSSACSGLRGFNFPGAGISFMVGGSANLSNKLPHATWTTAVVASSPGTGYSMGAAFVDGNNTGYYAGNDVSPYGLSASLSRSTETWTAISSVLTLPRHHSFYFNQGAI